MSNDTRDDQVSGAGSKRHSGRWLKPVAGALGYVARSALDLHRYRYVRTRMLHDSLRKLDGGCAD
ncbi:MAG: hypothetical protein WD448_00805 [Woeseia sp.]